MKILDIKLGKERQCHIRTIQLVHSFVYPPHIVPHTMMIWSLLFDKYINPFKPNGISLPYQPN